MSTYYRVSGIDRPLRLSPEHAETIGAEPWTSEPVQRPADGANKSTWVDYVAAAHGLDPAAASELTVAELKAYGHTTEE